MSIRKVPVTIRNGGTSSDWISAESISDNGTLAIVGIATPGTVDAVALSIDFSLDGATALPITDSAGAAVTITQAANKYITLAPASYPVIPGFFRLTAAGAVAADRNYKVVCRDIV